MANTNTRCCLTGKVLYHLCVLHEHCWMYKENYFLHSNRNYFQIYVPERCLELW